ncbi:MAG TPA: hypothetical protein VGG33_25685, partial [Polyangia bacterium]
MSVGVITSLSSARAQEALEIVPEEPEQTEALPLEFHGFVSQGFLKSTGNNYLAQSKRGSWEFAEVGINFTKTLSDRLRAGIQLFARDVGDIGNYDARVDWFYLDYRFADWLGLRAGRTKLPFGLYNEVSDIDSARVPVLMPQSIYSLRSRDYLLAQTGAELYGLVSLGGLGALEYRIYGGTMFADIANTSSTLRIERLDIPYLNGARLMWEAPLPGLRLGASLQTLELDYQFSGAAVANNPGAPMGIASAEISAW